MPHGKYMENLDKVDKLLRRFPNGVRAKELAKKHGCSRSTMYDYLNSLEAMGRARNEHSLWYPNETTQSEPKKHELTAETDFLNEKRQIREDFVNGQIDRAYKRTMVLIYSKKVSGEWIDKNGHLFKSLSEEEIEMEKNSLEKINPDRRLRIRKLRIAIVSEALKCWG